MTITEKILSEVETITSELALVLEATREIPGMYDRAVQESLDLCCTLPLNIRSGTLKIAVVGAIKSGKTTFVNTWLKDDLLKRGAGVVTSIVTRIRKKDLLKANIFLKSWDEINQEIEQALLLFPEREGLTIKDAPGFDLRRNRDRALLTDFYQEIFSGISLSDAGIRPESATISRAIEGFESVKDIIKPDSSILEFSGPLFQEHKRFTGDDAIAFFVRDVELEVTSRGLDTNLEIADCQGSDSTNPVHMAQIQDYLTSANLIIYLIGSRFGLRQADLNFLGIIKTMGMMENIIFVVNADFNGHEDLADLMGVEKRIRKELTYIKKDPELYTFSSLYNLFAESDSKLSPKNMRMLELWNKDSESVDYSASMTEKFNLRLAAKLDSEKFYLAVANPIERIRQVASNAGERLSFFADLLSSDLSRAGSTQEMLREMLGRRRKLETIMDTSTDGVVNVLEKEINEGAETLFDPNHGSLTKEVSSFIYSCRIDLSLYELKLVEKGFETAFYLMFQELKALLDKFMTQTVNSMILGFIHGKEKAMEDYFKALYRSYDINPCSISAEFSSIVEKLPETNHSKEPAINPMDLGVIKGILGLTLPKAEFATRYSARIRLDAMAKFGFFSLADILGRILKKSGIKPKISTLRSGEIRIKREMLRSVLYHLAEYKKAVTIDYLIPLAKALSRDFREKLIARFRVCDVEIETIEGLLALDQASKNSQLRTLMAMDKKLEEIVKRIETLPVQYLN